VTHDLQELIVVVATTKQRLATDHLCENAAYGPYVDGGTVRSRSHEDIRRTIPKRYDLIRKRVDRNTKCTGKTEVTNLQLAFSVDEQLVPLLVTEKHE